MTTSNFTSTITMVAMDLAKGLSQALVKDVYNRGEAAPLDVLTQLMCQAIEQAIEVSYSLEEVHCLSNHPLFYDILADEYDLALIGDGVRLITFLEEYFSMSVVEDSFWFYLDVDCIEGLYANLTEDTHIVRYESLSFNSDEIHWYFNDVNLLERALWKVDPTIELEF